MGDFERTYGAGADIVSIIDGYSRDYLREQRNSSSFSMRVSAETGAKTFLSFREAIIWAKANPGQAIIRIPEGDGFMVKKR